MKEQKSTTDQRSKQSESGEDIFKKYKEFYQEGRSDGYNVGYREALIKKEVIIEKLQSVLLDVQNDVGNAEILIKGIIKYLKEL